MGKKTGKKRKRKDKKSKSKRRKKDPNAPKRPKSAYFLFGDEHRPALMKKDGFTKPGREGKRIVDIGKIGKELGRMWRELSEDEKKPYKDNAAELKKAYLKKKAEYDASDKKKVTSSDESSSSGSDSD